MNMVWAVSSDGDQSLSEVFKFLQELERRIDSNWSGMKLILESLNIPYSRGFTSTCDKITKAYARQEFSPADIPLEQLQARLKDLSYTNDKAVYVYAVEQEFLFTAIDRLRSLEVEDTVFSKNYPYSCELDHLTEVDEEPLITHISRSDAETKVVLCCKRTFTEKTEINIDSFSTEDRAILEKYDSVVGTREIVEQFFDCAVIHHRRGTLELRIDKGNRTSRKDLERAHDVLYSKILLLLKLSPTEEALTKLNFFNHMGKIYNKKAEGRVCELAFECENESVHYQHYRRRKEDIRTEPFHVGGREATGDIAPFRLAVVWDGSHSTISHENEALFPGTRRMQREPMPLLDYFILKNCVRVDEFANLIDKVINIE